MKKTLFIWRFDWECAMTITGEQVKLARKLLGWTQGDLASRAGLSETTVAVFEAGNRRPMKWVIEAIRANLEKAGIEFTGEASGGVRRKIDTAQGATAANSLSPDVIAELRRLKAALPLVSGKEPKMVSPDASDDGAGKPDKISRAVTELADLIKKRIEGLEG
jgi:transcriptional regulator with XRE-family HTH domain